MTEGRMFGDDYVPYNPVKPLTSGQKLRLIADLGRGKPNRLAKTLIEYLQHKYKGDVGDGYHDTIDNNMVSLAYSELRMTKHYRNAEREKSKMKPEISTARLIRIRKNEERAMDNWMNVRKRVCPLVRGRNPFPERNYPSDRYGEKAIGYLNNMIAVCESNKKEKSKEYKRTLERMFGSCAPEDLAEFSFNAGYNLRDITDYVSMCCDKKFGRDYRKDVANINYQMEKNKVVYGKSGNIIPRKSRSLLSEFVGVAITDSKRNAKRKKRKSNTCEDKNDFQYTSFFDKHDEPLRRVR